MSERIYSTRTDAHQRTRDRSDGHTRWPTAWDRIAELRAEGCRFELCLCAGMIAGTVGVVFWSVS